MSELDCGCELGSEHQKYIFRKVLAEKGLLLVNKMWYRFLVCFFYTVAFVLGIYVGCVYPSPF